MSSDCVTAEWRKITGPVARVIGAEARTADLTLLSRPTDKFADLEILEVALFESGRPVLLRAGDMTEINSSVVIAWDGSLAAARAVAGAQDFITRAGMVTILIVEGDREDAPRRQSQDVRIRAPSISPSISRGMGLKRQF